ncbi:MAG: dephospho-CoA kinase [Planctomycetota bacterium]
MSEALGIPIIGIAGAIGSGKSLASSALADLGWLVIDFDEEVRQALRRPDVRKCLVSWWGEGVLDHNGAIDHKNVASIVFNDRAQLTRLEKFIHPLVWCSAEDARQRARDVNAPGVVLDAPLLFESEADNECDAVLFVHASRETRLARLERTRGWSEGELDRRESRQLSPEEKKARSRFVLENEGDESAFRDAVGEVAAILMQEAGVSAEPTA